ncbi:MAG: hypothetical protein NTX25_19655 [Proteobacteria bacterium]|nr:hypothetical protein [Pseudomonadota bacterium]
MQILNAGSCLPGNKEGKRVIRQYYLQMGAQYQRFQIQHQGSDPFQSAAGRIRDRAEVNR